MNELKFWVVWRNSGGSPSIKHASYQEAEQEASRLAKCNPTHTFYVLEVVAGKHSPIAPVRNINFTLKKGKK